MPRQLFPLTTLLALCPAAAAAQLAPDGGLVDCAVDSDCGGCGWVCAADGGVCAPALSGAVSSCQTSADCACPGQTCSGGICAPAFDLQCLCDADCPGGQICDETTSACHERPASCSYAGECGCGCACVDAGCACAGGCDNKRCLTGGGSSGDGGGTTTFFGGTTGTSGVGANCASAGGSCTADSQCCSQYCYQETCACNPGEDPATLPCGSNADCCSPAFCDAGLCFQPLETPAADAGLQDYVAADGGDTSLAGGKSTNPKISCSCQSSPGSAIGAGLVAWALLQLRRRRSGRQPSTS